MKCGVVSSQFERRVQSGALGRESEKLEFMFSDYKPWFLVRNVRSSV